MAQIQIFTVNQFNFLTAKIAASHSFRNTEIKNIAALSKLKYIVHHMSKVENVTLTAIIRFIRCCLLQCRYKTNIKVNITKTATAPVPFINSVKCRLTGDSRQKFKYENKYLIIFVTVRLVQNSSAMTCYKKLQLLYKAHIAPSQSNIIVSDY